MPYTRRADRGTLRRPAAPSAIERLRVRIVPDPERLRAAPSAVEMRTEPALVDGLGDVEMCAGVECAKSPHRVSWSDRDVRRRRVREEPASGVLV